MTLCQGILLNAGIMETNATEEFGTRPMACLLLHSRQRTAEDGSTVRTGGLVRGSICPLYIPVLLFKFAKKAHKAYRRV